ncbi:MAG: glycosyltransferase family 2 protein, partial [Hyphomicrobiales bacterium]
MGFWTSYRLRIQRRRWLVRALRKRRELRAVSDRSNKIKSDDLLLFSTLRNEHVRLPYFLNYYREQGINHFLIVDNDSNDGSLEYLAEQPDVSVWHSKHSYKKSRFGVDWLNWLQFRYGHDHWCL